MSSIEDRDIRAYLTDVGLQAELDFIANNQTLTISGLIIDADVLPDSRDPTKLTEPLNPAHAPFPVQVKSNDKALSVIVDIPANVGGFHINGLAFMAGDVLYAYARGIGDYKRVATSGQNDVMRLEYEILTDNAPHITHTYDGNTHAAMLSDLDDLAAQAEADFVKKVSEVSDSEIDSKSTASGKWVSVQRLWRAFTNLTTDSYDGTSSDKSLSQRGANALKNYVDQKISQLMGGLAPENLDTIVELGREISENESALANVTNELTKKADKVATERALAGKSSKGHTHAQYATHDDVTQQIETNGKGATGGINSDTGKRDETFFVNKKLASASFTIKADESAAHFGDLHIAEGAEISIEEGAELILL